MSINKFENVMSFDFWTSVVSGELLVTKIEPTLFIKLTINIVSRQYLDKAHFLP